jgi:hypothetical protein
MTLTVHDPRPATTLEDTADETPVTAERDPEITALAALLAQAYIRTPLFP